jgi:hypothetical protein
VALKHDEFELEKLKRLFDYTKFHVGVYLTVAGIFAGLIAATAKEPRLPFKFDRGWLVAAIGLIALAGLSGGILASSMCHEKSHAEFWHKRIGPWRLNLWSAEAWTYVEHTAFWAGMGCAFLSLWKG